MQEMKKKVQDQAVLQKQKLGEKGIFNEKSEKTMFLLNFPLFCQILRIFSHFRLNPLTWRNCPTYFKKCICRSSRSYCKSRADLGVWKGEWRCEITFNIKKEVYRHCSSQTALVFDLVLQSDRIFLHSSPEILLYILCFQRICLEASFERPGSGFVVFHSSTTTTTTMENDDDISVKQKWKIGHRFA